jgi:hypothetical protein
MRLVSKTELEQASAAIESAARGGISTMTNDEQTTLAAELRQSANASPPVEQPSKMDQLLEGLLGIVPLEGLAVWVIATEAFSKLTAGAEDAEGSTALLTVSDPGAIKVAIVAAMIVSVVSFWFGRREGDKEAGQQQASQSGVRLLGAAIIPPAAVFLWAYVINPSVLRTALERPEPDARWVVAVAAGWIVIIAAAYLGLTKKQELKTA